MSDLCDITTLAGRFTDWCDLQRYSDAQFITLQKANSRIKDLEEQVEHLKSLLSSSVPLMGEQKVDIIPQNVEQSICEIQINKLQKTAMDRELTLEETKRLDLLIKNLYMIKDQNKAIPANYSHIKNITDAQLISIASVPDPVEPDVE